MFHSFGETSAVHDAGVAVWKNKLLNSRIRPTTVIHRSSPPRRQLHDATRCHLVSVNS